MMAVLATNAPDDLGNKRNETGRMNCHLKTSNGEMAMKVHIKFLFAVTLNFKLIFKSSKLYFHYNFQVVEIVPENDFHVVEIVFPLQNNI
jgi:hypothetical protein